MYHQHISILAEQIMAHQDSRSAVDSGSHSGVGLNNRKVRLVEEDDSSLDLEEGRNFAAGMEVEETVTEDKSLLRTLEEDNRLSLHIH